jgi:hypothetical protein
MVGAVPNALVSTVMNATTKSISMKKCETRTGMPITQIAYRLRSTLGGLTTLMMKVVGANYTVSNFEPAS